MLARMETADTASRLQAVETAACTCASQQPWMSVTEAAMVIGRSPEYLYAGLREGRFPGVKFGRSWSIPRAFIRGFIAEVVELLLSISFEDYAAAWMSRAKAQEVA